MNSEETGASMVMLCVGWLGEGLWERGAGWSLPLDVFVWITC
jgi:hypothetical protein